jgi:mannosyltransferase OCH1-like enzyme
MLELSIVKTLDDTAQLPALLSMVRKRPAHIPTAIGLLVALRCRSLLKQRAEKGHQHLSHNTIPTIIGQYWDDPNPPRDLLNLSKSWQMLNPNHRHILFHEPTARTYLKDHFHRSVLTAYLRCNDPTTKADLFRLAFLCREGGVWADMDDRCMAPLSNIVPSAVEAFFWQESAGTLCNNFMGAIPRHPIFLRALGSAVQAINRGDRDKVWMLTGPGLITRAFACEMAESGDNWSGLLDRVTVLDEFELLPHVAIHCRTLHKRLGKHWTQSEFKMSRAKVQATAR